MICKIDSNGYCERHQCTHVGRDLVLCLDPSPKAEAYRIRFDKAIVRKMRGVKHSPTGIFRPRPCVHLGDPVRHNDEPVLVPCTKCRGKMMLQVFDCVKHGRVTATDCQQCSDFARRG